jgi:hypothetical protein
MNREETKKAIEVMQAYVNGAEIECLIFANVGYEHTINPQWNWEEVDYRVRKIEEIKK